MKIFTAIIFIFLVFFLSMAIAGQFRLNGVSSDLVFVAFVFIGLFSSGKTAFAAGLFAGFLSDLFSSSVFGIYLLAFAVVAVILTAAKSYVFAKPNVFVFLVEVFLAGIFFDLFVMILNKFLAFVSLQNFAVGWKYFFTHLLPLDLAMNLVAGLVIFTAIRGSRALSGR
jgi:rod shape-determining protein MreD